jgi:replicative superfamily II helicase
MAGRAGRLGFNEEGRAIILANNEYEREMLFQRYVMGRLDPLCSSFDPQHIETWILRLLAQVGQIARKDITRLLANTYGGYLAVKGNPKWRDEMEHHLEELLQEMIRLNLVEQEGALIRLTLLGQVCGRSSLLFHSVIRLVSLLKTVQNSELTAERLAALIQGLPELDRVVIPMMKTGRKESRKLAQSETQWPREAAQKFGTEIIQTLQRNADDFFKYYARCKRALLLLEWMQGTPIEAIEERYSVNGFNAVAYGHVRSCADTTRFHLRAAHQIATVMLIDKGPSEQSIETLLKQLEVGIPTDALDLLSISLPLTRGEYLALYQAGIRKPEDLWDHSSESIQKIIGTGRAIQLERIRPNPAFAKAD